MRVVAAVATLLVNLAVALTACGHPVTGARRQPVADSTPRIVVGPVDPDPRVGAIFPGGGNLHTCTGSVLESPGNDLMLTAAHCLSGGTKSTTFIPGFSGNPPAADVWTLNAVYFDPRWLAATDPHADYAIARLTRAGGGPAGVHLSPGLSLGVAPVPGSRVSVKAYPAGAGDRPVGCQADIKIADGYPALACIGLVDGTSGAPWMSGSTVTGLIGGLDGGGCDEKVSYSPPLDDHIKQLLTRAEAGGPGDRAPAAVDSGC